MKVPPDSVNKILGSVDKISGSTSGVSKTRKGKKSDFLSILKDSMNEVNQLQKEADAAAKVLASGEKIDIHNTMIAIQKADVSFRLMMEVRNKIVEAYHEIIRMQV